MRRAALALSILFLGLAAAPPSFTVDQILNLPQPDNLIASPVGSTIAWTFNERGGPEHLRRRRAGFHAAPPHAVYATMTGRS